ncbi:MAG: hypothetical protein Q7U30_05325 [Methylicorpusculum sp.]|nr:hypothetical protein [Methylicorpusculum sp.]
MNTHRKTMPSAYGHRLLETLLQAVYKTREKKRRLGQYAVTWKNGKPVMTGEDAPHQN